MAAASATRSLSRCSRKFASRRCSKFPMFFSSRRFGKWTKCARVKAAAHFCISSFRLAPTRRLNDQLDDRFQQAVALNVTLEDLAHVDEAAKIPLESFKSEIKAYDDRVARLNDALETKSEAFFVDMRTFLVVSRNRATLVCTRSTQFRARNAI